MKLVTFSTEATGSRLGALLDDQVLDLGEAHEHWLHTEHQRSFAEFPKTMLEYLQAGDPAREAANSTVSFAQQHLDDLRGRHMLYKSDDVTFEPPIARPGKIICVGMNYRKHIAEMGRGEPEYPVFFAKYANVLVGHRQPIRLPRVSQMVDYEAELAFVIGRTCKDVEKDDALSVIAGYLPFNDISVRDYQNRTLQWLQGKTFDSSGPIGPALVTADSVSNPQALDITLRLNGTVMQSSNTTDMFFDIPTIVNYLTQIMTLEAGDIVATGTPSGVGFARDPKVFLRHGDMVQIEIAELGVLENSVVAPDAKTEI